jgi:hypothetical protein
MWHVRRKYHSTYVSVADHPDACACCPDFLDQLGMTGPVQNEHRHISATKQRQRRRQRINVDIVM